MSTKIVAEIGINHNGLISVAKRLIDVAATAGCDYVKFQKRNPDSCVPEDQKSKKRNTPWGEMNYIDYKKAIEFNQNDYFVIDQYCEARGIKWFVSVWDCSSVQEVAQYRSWAIAMSDIVKIPSPMITNLPLIEASRYKFENLIMSTGMSTEEQIEKAVEVGDPDVIMHCNSTYPSPVNELNLNYIKDLKNKYGQVVGYSGHEYGLVTTFAAMSMGAEWIERHITLNRNMWGSDQNSSIEPSGVFKLVKGIRDIEKAMGRGGPRKVTKGEKEKLESLRRKK